MTTTEAQDQAAEIQDPNASELGRPSLLRAEFRRFRSRRFIRLLLMVALVGVLVPIGYSFTQFTKTTPEMLVAAQREIDENVVQSDKYRAECLQQPVPEFAGPGETVETYCGPAQTAENYGEVTSYLAKDPFHLESGGPDGALAMAVGSAAVMFLIGATFIGAEWSSRSLVALLFWETRRVRVMGAKLLVLGVAAALLAVLTQAVWWGSAFQLASRKGVSQVPSGFHGELFGMAGRGVLLTVVAALLGFGIANAVRHTAASLGVGFLYFAVIENAVRALKPGWAQWLLTDNAVALVQARPYAVYIHQNFVDAQGRFSGTSREIIVTHLHAGVVLTVVSAVVVGFGVLLFKRREVN